MHDAEIRPLRGKEVGGGGQSNLTAVPTETHGLAVALHCVDEAPGHGPYKAV
jgi:hypothetical protein